MEVVCLGLAVLDVVQRVSEPPRWGAKGVASSVELAAGGPATNAAIACAATGVPTTLVTALGDSAQGRLVRAECERLGVKVVDLVAAGERAGAGWEPPVASCIVDSAGERTVVSTGALASEFGLTQDARDALASARVLLLDGHHPAAAAEALSLRPDSCLAVLDAGSAKPQAEAWLPALDVVAGSADYAAGLRRLRRGTDDSPMGGEGDGPLRTDAPGAREAGEDCSPLDDAVAHVLAAGSRAAVMTDGAHPVRWATITGGRGRVAPPEVTAVDTLGAGDAWHGAFAAALAREVPLAEAVAHACEAASTRVVHEGARAWLRHLPPLPA